jgi:hypothetical protein
MVGADVRQQIIAGADVVEGDARDAVTLNGNCRVEM